MANPIIAPLNLADAKNILGDDEEPIVAKADPVLDDLLRSSNLSPGERAALRAQAKALEQQAKFRSELEELKSNESRQGIVSFLGPVPIGFQFGTAAGLTGVKAFLVDAFFDPINVVSGGLALTLTKMGKAARLLKGMSASEKADNLLTVLKMNVMSAKNVDGFAGELSAAVKTAKETKNADELINLFKRAKKQPLPQSLLDDLARDGPDGEDLAKFLKGDRRALGDLRAAFELGDSDRRLSEVSGFMAGIRTGQRSLLSLGIPFASRNFAELTLAQFASDIGIRRIARATGSESAEGALRNAVRFQPLTKTDIPMFRGQPLALADEVATARGNALSVMEEFPKRVDESLAATDDALKIFKTQERDIIKNIAGATGLPESSVGKVVKEALKRLDDPAKLTTEQLADNLNRALRFEVKAGKVATFPKFVRSILGSEGERALRAFAASKEGQGIIEQAASAQVAMGGLEALRDLTKASQASAKLISADAKTISGLADELATSQSAVKSVTAKKLDPESLSLDEVAQRLRDPEVTLESAVTKETAKQARVARQKAANAATRKADELNRIIGGNKGDLVRLQKARGNKTEITRAISDVLNRNAARALQAAPDLTKVKETVKGIRADRLEDAKGIAEEALRKQDVGDPPSTAKSQSKEALVRGATGQGTGSIKEVVTHFDEASRAIDDVVERGFDTPAGFVQSFSGFLQGMKGLGNLLAQRVRIMAGGDPKVLENIYRDIDYAAGEFLKGADPAIIMLRDAIDNGFTKVGQTLVRHGLVETFVHNYVPRIVRVTPGVDRELVFNTISDELVRRSKKVATTGRFKERRVANLKDLEEIIAGIDGAELATTRIDEAIAIYYQQVGDAVARQVGTQKTVTNHLGSVPVGVVGPIKEIKPDLVKQYGPEIANWIERNYVSMKGEGPLFGNLRINPEYIKPFTNVMKRESFFSKDAVGASTNNIANFFNYVNNLGKSMLFRFGVFHGSTLLVSGVPGFNLFDPAGRAAFAGLLKGTVGSTRLSQEGVENVIMTLMERSVTAAGGLPADMKNNVEFIRRAFESGIVAGKTEIGAYDAFTRMMDSVLQTPLTGDASNAFERMLQRTGQRFPVIQNPVRGVQHVNNLLDRNLWDIWHFQSKLLYWGHQRHMALLKDPTLILPKNSIKLRQVEAEIAGFSNAVFGGQAWDRLGVSPGMRKFLRFAFIAPDWTASNLLVARDLILTAPGIRELAIAKRLTPDVILADQRFHMAMQYSVRAGIYAFIFGNLANMAFTGGKTLFEADADAVDPSTGIPRIELPYRRADGRKQYMDWTKQFVEPIEWVKPLIDGDFKEFAKFLEPKAGVIPSAVAVTLTGWNPGLDRPVFSSEGGPFQLAMDALGAYGSHFVPIAAQQAFSVLRGHKDVRSAAISSVGFPVRTETKGAARRRERVQELEGALGQ